MFGGFCVVSAGNLCRILTTDHFQLPMQCKLGHGDSFTRAPYGTNLEVDCLLQSLGLVLNFYS